MSPAAGKSLLPFQLGFMRASSDDPNTPDVFDNEVDLVDAVFSYFATPGFTETKAAISAIAGTDIATTMGWFVGSCITTLLELDDVRFSVPRHGGISGNKITRDTN
ncbi:hypothetical protein G6011_00433 [Alternaria panax]|uniref:Uncharacterized protein n=1 Tax=Alternaria panax TaxID=48097 RepID=A0AAD4II79_9PLEO|nr:hypothetical protein G6011_00433 [Alternaria panax]